MSDLMTSPKTWEEFERSYGFTDKDEVYTNGARLIPSFRVEQWLEHMETQTVDAVRHGHWINHFDDLFEMESTIECSICGEKEWMMTIINHNYCPHCGAKMDEVEDGKT